MIKKAEVDLDNWESLRDFGKAVSDDEYNYISLNGGGGTSGGSDGDLAAKFRDAADAIRQLEFKRAEKEYQKIIDKDPKYPQAHLSLGSTFLMQGKVDAALTEFHKGNRSCSPMTRAHNRFQRCICRELDTWVIPSRSGEGC